MKNPLHPRYLKPLERRAELCSLLALGLVRLKQRERGELSDGTGEFPLHNPRNPSVHATPTHEEPA